MGNVITQHWDEGWSGFISDRCLTTLTTIIMFAPPFFCNESFTQFFIQIVFVAFNFLLAWVFASHEGPISLLGKFVAVI